MQTDAMMNKPIILFGAGQTGEKALAYYGQRNVYFFADNYKAGIYYCGKPVISIEDLKDIHKDYVVIVSAKQEYVDGILCQLDDSGIPGALLFDPLIEKTTFVSNPRLTKFKNIHKGKRCFLIGNGPSLRVEDLDAIVRHGDISFASNGIYRLYGSTKWRPDYYCVNDIYFMSQNWEDIISHNCGNLFIGSESNVPAGKSYDLIGRNKVYFFKERQLQYDSEKNALLPVFQYSNEAYPAFSDDVSKFFYVGSSITYDMMQCAAYMGVTEIFLLGVDFSYKYSCNYLEHIPPPVEYSKSLASDYFSKDYHKEGNLMFYNDPQLTGMAFEKAEHYSREHGFRIFNATRGGKLEVFERVDFDSLF